MAPLRIGASGNRRAPVGIFDARNLLLAAEPDRSEAQRAIDEILAAAHGGDLMPRPFRRAKIDLCRRYVSVSALRAFRQG